MSSANLLLPFDWDEEWYLRRYPDIAEALAQGQLGDPLRHYLDCGYREGRFSSAASEQRAQAWPGQEGNSGRNEVRLGLFSIPLDWPVQGEPRKTFLLRLLNNFFEKYLSGPVILDIGYQGGYQCCEVITPASVHHKCPPSVVDRGVTVFAQLWIPWEFNCCGY